MGNRIEKSPRRMSRRRLLKLGGLAAGGVVASALLEACGGGAETTTPNPTADVLKTESPMPSATPMATQAAESPIPTAISTAKPPEPTPTEVSKAPVNCEVLPQEFCSQGKRITMELQGEKHEYIAFNLPPGTPILARFDGLLDKIEESGDPFSGFSAVLTPDNYRSFDIARGDIHFDDMIQRQVRQGDVIGYVGDAGIKNFDYNVLYLISTASPDGPIIDEGKMKELFPEAFEKESVEITYNGPVNPPVSYDYSSTPPGQ